MKKVYIDCNILLDWVLQRREFVDEASLLIALVAKKQLIGVVSPLTIANVYYMVQKAHDKDYALGFVKQCETLFTFCDNTGQALHCAINRFYRDFEDDIHYHSVIDSGIDTIVTRNPKDFPSDDKVAILTPNEMLTRLGY